MEVVITVSRCPRKPRVKFRRNGDCIYEFFVSQSEMDCVIDSVKFKCLNDENNQM